MKPVSINQMSIENVCTLLQCKEGLKQEVFKLIKKQVPEAFTPLNEDQLDEFIWEKLRSCDEDHDQVQIEKTFNFYRNKNKKDPISLRMQWLRWNSPAY